MSDLFGLLGQLGVWGLLLCVPVLIGYVNASGAAEERLREVLNSRWVMVTWVGVALAAWVWTWMLVLTGGAYLHGSGRWTWLPVALIVGTGLAATVALLATTRWPRLRPWLTLLLVVLLCLGSTQIRGAAPDPSFKQGNRGEAIRFVQQRLEALHCYQDGLDGVSPDEFDAPTANAVISFQQANNLLSNERDLPHEGEVRDDPEFRLLANPLSRVASCPKK